MKRQLFPATLLLLSTLGVAQTWRGRVSDLVCGKNVNAGCNKQCIKNGEPPVLVVDDSGDILTIQNPDLLKSHAGEHVEVAGTRTGSVLTVNRVTSIAESTPQMAAVDTQWLGTWVGVYRNHKGAVPIWLHLASTENGMKATLDILPRDSGLAASNIETTKDGFSVRVPHPGGDIQLEVHKRGDTISATATEGNNTVPLLLAKRAEPDLKTVRSYEGIYRSGKQVFLFEHLAADYINFVELPSGEIRGAIPVANDEFITGPTLMESLPVQTRLKFLPRAGRDGFDLVLVKNGRKTVAHPEPLHREEVSFSNGEVKLAGTLILPTTPGPHPAIVFMHGSGEAPRTSYFGFGYWLASQGFVVLKYDKRGSGASTGDLMMSSYEDLADDAIAGARFLQSRREVDPKRIGFWGISEGAWTAPLAASRFPDAAFAIGMSGGGLSPSELELLVTKDQLHSDGRFSPGDIEHALAFERARDDFMRTGKGWDEYARLREKAVHEAWYSYPITDLFGPSKPDAMFWDMDRRFYFYDPAPALRALRSPVLFIEGGMDAPTLLGPNSNAIRAALNPEEKDSAVKVYPNGDHEMFLASEVNQAELSRAQRFVPGLFKFMTSWLRRVSESIEGSGAAYCTPMSVKDVSMTRATRHLSRP